MFGALSPQNGENRIEATAAEQSNSSKLAPNSLYIGTLTIQRMSMGTSSYGTTAHRGKTEKNRKYVGSDTSKTVGSAEFRVQ